MTPAERPTMTTTIAGRGDAARGNWPFWPGAPPLWPEAPPRYEGGNLRFHSGDAADGAATGPCNSPCSWTLWDSPRWVLMASDG